MAIAACSTWETASLESAMACSCFLFYGGGVEAVVFFEARLAVKRRGSNARSLLFFVAVLDGGGVFSSLGCDEGEPSCCEQEGLGWRIAERWGATKIIGATTSSNGGQTTATQTQQQRAGGCSCYKLDLEWTVRKLVSNSAAFCVPCVLCCNNLARWPAIGGSECSWSVVCQLRAVVDRAWSWPWPWFVVLGRTRSLLAHCSFLGQCRIRSSVSCSETLSFQLSPSLKKDRGEERENGRGREGGESSTRKSVSRRKEEGKKGRILDVLFCE